MLLSLLSSDSSSQSSVSVRQHVWVLPRCSATAIAVPAGVFTNLSTVSLNNNQLTGPLPNSWGENGNLPSLQSLDVSANNLTSSLPSVWGHNGSFHLLTNLNLANNTLSGSLPTAWAEVGRFPALQQLEVQYNQLSGAKADLSCFLNSD